MLYEVMKSQARPEAPNTGKIKVFENFERLYSEFNYFQIILIDGQKFRILYAYEKDARGREYYLLVDIEKLDQGTRPEFAPLSPAKLQPPHRDFWVSSQAFERSVIKIFGPDMKIINLKKGSGPIVFHSLKNEYYAIGTLSFRGERSFTQSWYRVYFERLAEGEFRALGVSVLKNPAERQEKLITYGDHLLSQGKSTSLISSDAQTIFTVPDFSQKPIEIPRQQMAVFAELAALHDHEYVEMMSDVLFFSHAGEKGPPQICGVTKSGRAVLLSFQYSEEKDTWVVTRADEVPLGVLRTFLSQNK